MILVTGAAGKTGKAVIASVQHTGEDVRAFIARPSQEKSVRAAGATEIAIGDMCDLDAFRRAMDGIRAVYHIAPNLSVDEVTMGKIAIEAAQWANVERFGYHSVLHPQIEAMPHHWNKMRIEEELVGSGLDFVILQPGVYLENLRGSWSSIIEKGVYRVPYGIDSPFAMVALRDVAAAAARVLTEDDHSRSTYQLAYMGSLTPRLVSSFLSITLDIAVRAERIPEKEWPQIAEASGLNEQQAEMLFAMFRYYDRLGLPGNANILRWLLGRPLTTIREVIEWIAAEKSQAAP